jgi:hypothetical protein
MHMNLECATKEGVICDDVKDFAAGAWATTGLATYRGIGRCSCGTPMPLHIETYWRGSEPTLLRVSISGEQCPDCGAVLSLSTVIYRGIYSPGWPFIPATPINIADLSLALAVMEREQCVVEQPGDIDKHDMDQRPSCAGRTL